MAKAFSVASWNVEHFADKQGRNEQRIEFLAEQKPDVVAIFEVEGKDVWRELMDTMKGYSFFITEGQNAQEILLGIAPGITGFLTQRTEFQENNAFMRPGALLTVRAHGEDYARAETAALRAGPGRAASGYAPKRSTAPLSSGQRSTKP